MSICVRGCWFWPTRIVNVPSPSVVSFPQRTDSTPVTVATVTVVQQKKCTAGRLHRKALRPLHGGMQVLCRASTQVSIMRACRRRHGHKLSWQTVFARRRRGRWHRRKRGVGDYWKAKTAECGRARCAARRVGQGVPQHVARPHVHCAVDK